MEHLQHPSTEELLPKDPQTPEGHVEGQTEVALIEERYKNLESTYTKANQERIDMARKLVEKDKSELLNIKDVKLQNKIVKDLYGYDNLAELQAIHGDKFYETGAEEESDIYELKQKVKLMEYRTTKSDTERAINDYIKTNQITEADAFNKITEELKWLSSDLDLDERVVRAGKIAFVAHNPNSGYLAMQDKTVISANKPADKTDKKPNELDGLFSGILDAQKRKNAYVGRFNP